METMKRKFTFPHSYTLIFILIILAAILTWIIPSGQFETVVENVAGMEKTTVVPGTYHQIDKADYGQGFSSILMAPAEGCCFCSHRWWCLRDYPKNGSHRSRAVYLSKSSGRQGDLSYSDVDDSIQLRRINLWHERGSHSLICGVYFSDVFSWL